MAIFKPQDYEHLIGQWWRHDGFEYRLNGILYGDDDWYWVMCRAGAYNKHTQLLSCALNIENFGYEQVNNNGVQWYIDLPTDESQGQITALSRILDIDVYDYDCLADFLDSVRGNVIELQKRLSKHEIV